MKKIYLFTIFLAFSFSFFNCAQQKVAHNTKVVENGKNIPNRPTWATMMDNSTFYL